jgi:hypothetical protein
MANMCNYCGSARPAPVCTACGRDKDGYGPSLSIMDGVRVGFGMFIALPILITGVVVAGMLILAILGIRIR